MTLGFSGPQQTWIPEQRESSAVYQLRLNSRQGLSLQPPAGSPRALEEAPPVGPPPGARLVIPACMFPQFPSPLGPFLPACTRQCPEQGHLLEAAPGYSLEWGAPVFSRVALTDLQEVPRPRPVSTTRGSHAASSNSIVCTDAPPHLVVIVGGGGGGAAREVQEQPCLG